MVGRDSGAPPYFLVEVPSRCRTTLALPHLFTCSEARERLIDVSDIR